MPATVPEQPEFTIGARYVRTELHDRFSGNRRSGVSSPAEEGFTFVFTGPSDDPYGNENKLSTDGTLTYYGEGRVGDMEFEPNNANTKLRDHREHGLDLHVFVETLEDGVMSYLGEYAYDSHQWIDDLDGAGDTRRMIQFQLVPVDSGVVLGDEGLEGGSERDLFVAAWRGTLADGSMSPASDGGQTYSQPELLRQFALRSADGVCPGCGEEIRFVDANGDPFLEVHHLHRRSDGGANSPEHVIALCPNCHRRRHLSPDGDAFNQKLIETAKERNERLWDAVDDDQRS